MLIGMALVAWLYNWLPFYIFVLIGFLWLGFTIWASFDIRSNYFIKAHISYPKTVENVIALTFDDGPTEFTPLVLNLLKRYNQKATFFCIGKQVEQYPKIVQEIVAQGHTIANHTFTHTQKMGFLSKKKVDDEIASNQSIIAETVGKTPRFFRPPFGVTNPNIADACKKNKVEVIGWNIRSLDTVLSGEEKILNRMVPRLKKGSIVLLHDTTQKTTNVLEQLLILMQEQHIRSVTVDELLKIKAYK